MTMLQRSHYPGFRVPSAQVARCIGWYNRMLWPETVDSE